MFKDLSARPDPEIVKKHAQLRTSLLQELMQSERSAQLHCVREASRLGDSAPARALRACAQHAERVNVEVREAARQMRVADEGVLGKTVGRLLSAARSVVVDRIVDEERSYRGTLAGLRHGVDVVRMLQHVADASGEVELAGFCTRWLAEREVLVDSVAHAMTWFALHPQVAVEHPGTARELAESAARPN
jgi:hypothetical protein